MPLRRFIAAAALAVATISAQAPLPGLRVEAVPAGSVIFVRNPAAQPLTACLIELVGYPGSSFTLWRDAYVDNDDAYTRPGEEKRIPVSSMTVGAVPDYVKVQAAVYEDGSSSGVPEKIKVLLDRRRAVLEAMRSAIQRIGAQPDNAALVRDLESWAESQPRGANQAAVRNLILMIRKAFDTHPRAEVLDRLRRSEHELAGTKPPLQ